VSALLRETGRTLSEADIAMLQRAHQEEYLAQADSVRPLPGAAELLDFLKGAGLPLALVTSSSLASVEKHLGRAGLYDRFDAIVTGVRAYERRADLRANNSLLLDYVNRGGTVIVQYNKFEFNEAQYGPYPAKVSNDRVTDEHAPVKVLNENSPLLNAPNRINEETWNGWVQERGLYFLDADHDSRYKDLLEISDPFEFNKGAKKGALVEAQYGKGHWVYVGLGLWRELPAGVDGS